MLTPIQQNISAQISTALPDMPTDLSNLIASYSGGFADLQWMTEVESLAPNPDSPESQEPDGWCQRYTAILASEQGSPERERLKDALTSRDCDGAIKRRIFEMACANGSAIFDKLNGLLGEIRNQGHQINLDGVDLSKLSLTGLKLCGCSAVGANFCGASLIGTSLAGADLSNATFDGARLWFTVMGGANLHNANFDNASVCDYSIMMDM